MRLHQLWSKHLSASLREEHELGFFGVVKSLRFSSKNQPLLLSFHAVQIFLLTDNTKRGGVTGTPHGCAISQRDLNKPEKRVKKNLMKFNKGKCQILHLERKTPMLQYRLRAHHLESSLGVHEPAMVPLQQRWLTASWIALGVVLPAGWGKWAFPLTEHWWDNSVFLSLVLSSPVQEKVTLVTTYSWFWSNREVLCWNSWK